MQMKLLSRNKNHFSSLSSAIAHLFKCSLCEQVTFNSAKCLMRVVVGLFNQSQLLSLRLVQTTLHTKRNHIYVVKSATS